jgi:peptide-methionine (R)-S-oxide reductase
MEKSKSAHLSNIDPDAVDWKAKTQEYWQEALTPDQFRVCRLNGTEPPFFNEYNNYYEPGTYICSNCALPLFSSKAKYDSGTGWPSFTNPINSNAVILEVEKDWFDKKVPFLGRVEVRCARCNAHLGHVFDDGPAPTGKRYCMNSVCLIHEEKV